MTDNDLDCLTTVECVDGWWQYRCIVCPMESMPLPNQATARRYARLHEISGTHKLREIMDETSPRHHHDLSRLPALVILLLLALTAGMMLALIFL